VISDGYGSPRPGMLHAGVDLMFARIATDPFPGNSESMAALIRTEIEQWGRYARLAKIEPQ